MIRKKLMKRFLAVYPPRGIDPQGNPQVFENAVEDFNNLANNLSPFLAMMLWLSCFCRLPNQVPPRRKQGLSNIIKNYFGWSDILEEEEAVSTIRTCFKLLWNMIKAPFFVIFNSLLLSIGTLINVLRFFTEFSPAIFAELSNGIADLAFAKWVAEKNLIKLTFFSVVFFLAKSASIFFEIAYFVFRAMLSPGLLAPWKDGESLAKRSLVFFDIEHTSLLGKIVIFTMSAAAALLSALITITFYLYCYPLLSSLVINSLGLFFISTANAPQGVMMVFDHAIVPVMEMFTVLGENISVITYPFYDLMSATVVPYTVGWALNVSVSLTIGSSGMQVIYSAAKARLTQWWHNIRGTEKEEEASSCSSSASRVLQSLGRKEATSSQQPKVEKTEPTSFMSVTKGQTDAPIIKPGDVYSTDSIGGSKLT